MATSYASLTTDDLVTGEAVALDLPPAALGLRMASGSIDFFLTWVLFLVIYLVTTIGSLAGDTALQALPPLLASIGAFLVYPTLLETLTRGRSVGKLALGLRTVRVDAGPITFHHALTRALFGLVELYTTLFLPAAFFAGMLTTKHQRLGDLAAGTYVVRERMSLKLPQPPPMPRELASWAARADLATLPTGLSLAVRQYLGRLPQLDPHSRQVVGTALLDDVRRYVAPPPPRAAPPEYVLGAVIAERRERDLRRLQRDQELRARLMTSS